MAWGRYILIPCFLICWRLVIKRVNKRHNANGQNAVAAGSDYNEHHDRLATTASRVPLTNQVFVSHTGQDDGAKHFAASVLKPALQMAGLPVFMDFQDLKPGDPWPDKLVDAAAHSAVVVAVLSKTYPRRYWCMLELDVAMHGVQKIKTREKAPLIIPVFYDSTDEVVQQQAIQKHWAAQMPDLPRGQQVWIDPDRWSANVAQMKDQLQAVRLYSGGQKDSQWQAARSVVAAAVQAVPMHADVDEVMGFDEQEAQLVAELTVPNPERLGLWLHGLGGLGKTTMAKLLYNRLQQQFSHRAFLELQPEEGCSQAAQHLVSILKQLGASEYFECQSATVLLTVLSEFVKHQGREVLLVIDNVWEAEQLDALLPRQFCEGTRIIMTSRFSAMPQSSWWKVHQGHLQRYQLEVLQSDVATLVFRTHTGLPDPPAELCEMEKEIIAACGGLPLALKVVGSQLYAEEDAVRIDYRLWKEVHADFALRRSWAPQDTSEKRLEGIVALTFQNLSGIAKHMFLDCVSVLDREDSERALRIWEALWGGQGGVVRAFKELQRRALVRVDEFHLVVHDVILLLGQAIIFDQKSPFCGSRVWVGRDERLVQFDKVPTQPIMAVNFQGSCELSSTGYEEDISQWWGNNAFDQLQMLMGGCMLVASLHGEQAVSFGTEFGQMKALRVLNLSQCRDLKSLPESLGQLTALRILDLGRCYQLQSLPESVGQLATLQVFDSEGLSSARVSARVIWGTNNTEGTEPQRV